MLVEGLSEWLANQNGIYERFRQSLDAVRTEGILPDPSVFKTCGGLLVTIEHSGPIVDRVTSLSESLGQFVPAIMYQNNCIHTTLIGYDLRPEREYSAGEDDTTIELLANAIKEELVALCDSPAIRFSGEILCNKTTIILPGVPNEAFLNLASAAIERSGLANTRGPVMAHITVLRFKEQLSADQLSPKFFQLVENGIPEFESIPVGISVGYFHLDSSGVSYSIHRRLLI